MSQVAVATTGVTPKGPLKVEDLKFMHWSWSHRPDAPGGFAVVLNSESEQRSIPIPSKRYGTYHVDGQRAIDRIQLSTSPVVFPDPPPMELLQKHSSALVDAVFVGLDPHNRRYDDPIQEATETVDPMQEEEDLFDMPELVDPGVPVKFEKIA